MTASLTACAPKVWIKPGASQQDFTTDRYSCERDARQSGYFGTGIVGAINMQNFYESCMNAHGWYPQQQASAATARVAAPSAPPPDYSNYDNLALCRIATNWSTNSWEPSATYANAVAAAQGRGLTLEQCNAMRAAAASPSGVAATTPTVAPSPSIQSKPIAKLSVAMRQEAGTYVIPVTINNAITLDFIVDSGAADVSIPADVVLTLVRTGTLRNSDFLGTKKYTLADGSTVPSTTFKLRSLKVGDRVVENVTAGVSDVKGALLLGQSFLGRLKSWSVDNTKHALVFE
jgi:aspartyl protease family protein